MKREVVKWKKAASGLTLVELMLVVSILAILLSLGTVVFSTFGRQDRLLLEARGIEGIINEAKIKTLAGFSLGEAASQNFGVYFQADRYVFFPGQAYNPENVGNQVFVLPESLEIAPIFFPGNSLVFTKITGEVLGYNPDQNYLVLSDKKTSAAKRINVNKLGVVKIEDQ